MAESAELLERRCRRLLVAYPAGYRAERGAEMVALLLDLAGPGRTWPRVSDAADVVAGGLRRRLGTTTTRGLEAGLPLAAPIALALAAGLAGFAWWRIEPVPTDLRLPGTTLFGEFRTLGPIAYLFWLIAAAGRGLLPARWARRLVAVAIAVTMTLPVLAPLTGVDRPPLWVLTALCALGLIAFGGTVASTVDERLGVPLGAVAVAVSASAAMLAWPPSGGGFGYYYQPTIARVGTVAGITVLVVVAIAVVRIVRGRSSRGWLWAAALLGFPAGWLGPFDSTGLALAAAETVPHFGRLAHVLLASSLAVATIAWLARARPGPHALAVTGVGAVGTAVGLSTFLGTAGAGALGFAGVPLANEPLPRYVLGTIAAIAVVGLVAAGGSVPRRWRVLLMSTVVGFGLAWLVAVYVNGWTVSGWARLDHTSAFVITLAFLPLSACALVAGLALAQPSAGGSWAYRVRARLVLAVSLGWLGYATVPYVLAWGPVLLLLVAGVLALALSRWRGSTEFA